jgi:hypothetical protein
MLRNFTNEFSTNPAVMLAVSVSVLLVPFLIKTLKVDNIKFIKPALLGIASFLMVFSMYLPSALIFNNEGPLRQINIRLMVMVFMIFLNSINAIGYFISKSKSINKVNPIIILTAFLVTVTMAFSTDKFMEAWSIRAKYQIMGLEVSRFTGEMNEAFSQLEDENVKSVDLSGLITNEMLMPDINSFKNYSIISFYDKDEVVYTKNDK